LSDREDSAADSPPRDAASSEPTASRPKPNARPGPGSIGNTVGLITPKPQPNGSIENGRPTRITDPPALPETPQEASVWDRVKGAVHTGLDIAGFVPGLGVVPDLANAALYGLEGNKAEALMAAMAAVPGAGDALKAGTLATKGGKAVGKEALQHADEAASRAARERAEKELAENRAREQAERETAEAGGGSGVTMAAIRAPTAWTRTTYHASRRGRATRRATRSTTGSSPIRSVH
jgi:hypothetical protein